MTIKPACVSKLTLTFKDPSIAAKNLDLTTVVSDLHYAAKYYNSHKWKGNKREIKIIKINPVNLVVLVAVYGENVSENCYVKARDLEYFMKRLTQDRSWGLYSNNETALFKASNITSVTKDYKDNFESIDVVPKEFVLQDDEDEDITKEMDRIAEINDKQLPDLIRALVEIQNIGNPSTILHRQKCISEIKSLLISALN